MPSRFRRYRAPDGKMYWSDGVVSRWSAPVEVDGVFVKQGSHHAPLCIRDAPIDTVVASWNAWALVHGKEVLSVDRVGDVGAFVTWLVRESCDLSELWNDDVCGVILPLPRKGWWRECLEDEVEVENGGILLRGPREERVEVNGVVSCSVFRFGNAYRDTRKYALGLVWLCHAVGRLFSEKGVRLLVFADASVDPEHMAKNGASDRDISLWQWTWEQLALAPHATRIWFCSPPFQAPQGFVEEHVDLFGTLARFLPLFPTTPSTPTSPWWYQLPPNTPVYCSDADFQDWNLERVALLLFAAALDRPAAAESSSPDGGHGGGGGEGGFEERTRVEELSCLALSSGGSSAPRHLPSPGMPPLMSGNFIGVHRFPIAWLVDFLRDAKRGVGKSMVAGAYRTRLMDASSRNVTFTKRRVADQASLFPFGIDEFFLTAVVAPRSRASLEHVFRWDYLIVPAVDRILSKLLSLDTAKTSAIHAAVAKTADVASRTNPPQTWPKAAARRAQVYATRCDGALAMAGEDGSALAKDLHAAVCAGIEACTAGSVPHTDKDLEWLLQNAAYAAPSPDTDAGIIAAKSFAVGRGAVSPLSTPSPVLQKALALLKTDPGPSIPQPTLPPGLLGTKRPRY